MCVLLAVLPCFVAVGATYPLSLSRMLNPVEDRTKVSLMCPANFVFVFDAPMDNKNLFPVDPAFNISGRRQLGSRKAIWDSGKNDKFAFLWRWSGTTRRRYWHLGVEIARMHSPCGEINKVHLYESPFVDCWRKTHVLKVGREISRKIVQYHLIWEFHECGCRFNYFLPIAIISSPNGARLVQNHCGIHLHPWALSQSKLSFREVQGLFILQRTRLDALLCLFLGQIHRARQPVDVAYYPPKLFISMLAALGHEPYLENSGSSIKQGPKSNQDTGKREGPIVNGSLFPTLKKFHRLLPLFMLITFVGAFCCVSRAVLFWYFPPRTTAKLVGGTLVWILCACICVLGFLGSLSADLH